jgi:hypothetical protein
MWQTWWKRHAGVRDADAADIILDTPGAPPLGDQCSKRVKPVHYSQEQEKEAIEKARKKIIKNWEGKRCGQSGRAECGLRATVRERNQATDIW